MGNCLVTRKGGKEPKILLQKNDFSSLVETCSYSSPNNYTSVNETPLLWCGQSSDGTNITCAIKKVDVEDYTTLRMYAYCDNNNTSLHRYYMGIASSNAISETSSTNWKADIEAYASSGAIFHTASEVFTFDLKSLTASQKEDLNIYFKVCGGYSSPQIWVYPILIVLE